LHYNPSLISIDDVRRIARRAGAKIANRYRHEVIPVEGMDCSDCVIVLEHSLNRIEGVLDVNASYTAQKVFIEYDSKKTNRGTIEKRIKNLGYLVPQEGARKWYVENRVFLFSLTAGFLLLLGWSGDRFFGFPYGLSLALYLAAYILAGRDTAIHAWYALKARTFNTDLLMITAALGAAFLGEYAEGALLLFLFSLGHALEGRILDRARNAIRALADLAPKTAIVRRNSRHGSLNGEGALEIQVTRLAKDSTLARVTQMVEQAQAGASCVGLCLLY
jgi:Cd2+/Zn2+-exporting ATPase